MIPVPSGQGRGFQRAQTAAGRVQAQVEEADAEKQGPAVLGLALKDMEGLGIGVDPREA